MNEEVSPGKGATEKLCHQASIDMSISVTVTSKYVCGDGDSVNRAGESQLSFAKATSGGIRKLAQNMRFFGATSRTL